MTGRPEIRMLETLDEMAALIAAFQQVAARGNQ